jgi:curli biogenesis system outer membrane secretion channel CsgG
MGFFSKALFNTLLISFIPTVFTSCVTNSPTVVHIEKQTVSQTHTIIKEEVPTLKRKVAIARFGNEAQYGRSTLFGMNNNYNAEKQATDILSAKLVQSGKFILLERNDIDIINKEINTFNLTSLKIGADYLIVGSVTEFGRKNISDVGVFNRSMRQIAYAKVSVRLIDVTTGEIIFAQESAGEAESEAGKSFGIGQHTGYDSTLNDKAISSAISGVVDGIMQNLLDKNWRSYVLSIDNDVVMIAGGKKQGLKIGESFSIYKKGSKIINPQTGMMVELPGIQIAKIKVISQFGTNYTNEGSQCKIINGNLMGADTNVLYVQK